jgi:ankyrin repeat protein
MAKVVPSNAAPSKNDEDIKALSFLKACISGQKEIVADLLRNDPQQGKSVISRLVPCNVQFNNTSSEMKLSPLMAACVLGHTEVVELLLQNPHIQINQIISSKNETALYLAAQAGHANIVRLLLEYKPVTNKSTNRDWVNFASSMGSRHTALSLACEKKHINVVRELLKAKEVNVHTTNPLYIACDAKDFELTALLLTRPDLQLNITVDGVTALTLALEHECWDIVKLLLNDGREVFNKKIIGHRHPLSTVVRQGTTEGIITLFQHLIKKDNLLYAMPNEELLMRLLKALDPKIQIDTANVSGTKKTLLKMSNCSLTINFSLLATLTEAQIRARADFIASLFSIIVFLCDNLLELSEKTLSDTQKAYLRFFAKAKELPIELQMILCHRVFGSSGINIPAKDCEQSFRELALRLYKDSLLPQNNRSSMLADSEQLKSQDSLSKGKSKF